VVTNKYHK